MRAGDEVYLTRDNRKRVSIEDTSPEQTDQFPQVPYRVLHANVPFYSDPECKNEVKGARITILEALDPDDEFRELDIVPTRTEYRQGQLLTWSLNNKQIWEESWYKHPETQQIERVWARHVEFTGELISKQALAENKDKLAEIERRLSEHGRASEERVN